MSPKEQDVSIVYRTVMPSGNSSSAAAFNLESLGSVQQAKYRDLIRADQITEPKVLPCAPLTTSGLKIVMSIEALFQ